MDTLPVEFYGIAGGAIILFLVDKAKEAGFPEDWAGLLAIAIAWIIGSAALLIEFSYPVPRAILGGLLWGGAIVVTHYTIVKPIATRNQQPRG